MVGEKVDELLSKIAELEKRLPKLADTVKVKEAKKGIEELRKLLPDIVQFVHASRPKAAMCKVMAHRPSLSKVIGALEDKETTITVSFDELSITLNGSKSFSLSLLKKSR